MVIWMVMSVRVMGDGHGMEMGFGMAILEWVGREMALIC